jgi:hypothetical protein
MLPIREGNLRARANLRSAPKIATEIGNLNAAWAAVEFRMLALFILFTGAPVPIARAAF